MINIESKHLKDVNMSYIEHMLFSLSLSKIFLKAGVKAIVHSFFPDFLVTSTTDSIEVLKTKMKHRSKL